ncbi:MAG: ribosome biogenesis GTP-binding protein YihA/YsxC [Clostridiales bacterium]|nr:ribosome biogenesis GTP-binding protein YihA/YsxC [Clostridiales bacterium]MDU1041771.1 ribosome biogenesis GTP-binding protein YihA/YsxC [Clostridiales bacterium]MDU3489614.1 ribosome biogenesis GTP-binding protein YihA/YsxC [Clostridiales bacterium]
MVIKKVNLDIVIGVKSEVPDTEYPEVAFAGKSNVGKSSLINAMMNRKAYARTSAQPGKTQTINYYNVNDEIYLVDLPGYGYTRANVKVKEQWGKMVERYLRDSKQLKRVFLLVDSRHAPSENDRLMFDWIVSNGFRPVVVATKGDKLKRSENEKNKSIIRKGLNMLPEDTLIMTSSSKKERIEEVWAEMLKD